jgi:rhodanese-related sulfurtransferase
MLRVFICTVMVAMLCGVTLSSVGADTGESTSSAPDMQLPERKQTTLGLYVTAAQAYEKWKAAPDEVTVIDVRTPEEYVFVGHPEMAWNIPFAFLTYGRKDGKTEYKVEWNTDFVTEVKGIAEPTDILLITCRSGDRSAMAVNKLAEAGFTQAYTVTDARWRIPEASLSGRG